MLAPVKVNPIDHAFNAVLAQAVVVMANWPNALAGRLAARVREPPTAQPAGQVSLPRAPGERDLGDRVVDAAQVVAHFFFTFNVTANAATPRWTSRLEPSRERLISSRGAGVHPRESSNYCFIFNCRLIAAAASWAFLTESACLPASCSALASLARATSFFEASSVLPAVASVICLIRVGHWLASAGPATRPTIARDIRRFFIQITSIRREGLNHRPRGSLLQELVSAEEVTLDSLLLQDV